MNRRDDGRFLEDRPADEWAQATAMSPDDFPEYGPPETAGIDELARFLVYDGACPLCRAYASCLESFGGIRGLALIDAREDGLVCRELTRRGIDLDRGMVLKADGKLYAGDEALRRIAAMSRNRGPVGRLNAMIFRSPRRAKRIYPWLRRARDLSLAVSGRSRLHGSG